MSDTVIVTGSDNDDSTDAAEAVAEAVTEAAEHETIVEIAQETARNEVTLEFVAAAVSELSNRVAMLEQTAQAAVSIADTAVEIASEAAEEASNATDTVEVMAEMEALEPEPILIVEPIEEDKAPGKTHWFNRPASEWFGRE
ncbi:MAG: hypothetical protein KDA17_05540 [Candidatus Saccharibacteria bacterium]|nr:hypothetical protein [Candidatus Saccharibacteria bacterium]